MEHNITNLKIKFDSPGLESGVVDAKDMAYTIVATADLLRFIAKSSKSKKTLRVDVNAFQAGSFEVHLAISLKDLLDNAPAAIPLLAQIDMVSSAKQIVEIFKKIIKVRKFLEGEKPSQVEIVQNEGSSHIAIYKNSGHIDVNVNTYNILQSESANKKLQKIVYPFLKDKTELGSIEISEEDSDSVQITKAEAPYFAKGEELQTTPHRVRGIVTALDRKTYNGKISVGDKRVNYEIEIEDISKLDKVVDGLIESMKHKIAIIAIGEAAFDYESNLKKLKIKDIEKEAKLLEA